MSFVYPGYEKRLKNGGDMQENHVIRTRGQSLPKRPRYQEMSGMEASDSRVHYSTRFSATTVREVQVWAQVYSPDSKNFLEVHEAQKKR